MAIALVRIDDRLVHGQVVEGWLRVIDADTIVVVNDDVAKDDMQRTLYSLSVPPDVSIECLSVDSAIEQFKNNKFSKQKLLILLSRPADLLKMLKNGLKVSSVNVGGLHYSPGKKQILKGLSLDDNDVSVLREIAGFNIELESRALPKDDRLNVIDLIKASY